MRGLVIAAITAAVGGSACATDTTTSEDREPAQEVLEQYERFVRLGGDQHVVISDVSVVSPPVALAEQPAKVRKLITTYLQDPPDVRVTRSTKQPDPKRLAFDVTRGTRHPLWPIDPDSIVGDKVAPGIRLAVYRVELSVDGQSLDYHVPVIYGRSGMASAIDPVLSLPPAIRINEPQISPVPDDDGAGGDLLAHDHTPVPGDDQSGTDNTGWVEASSGSGTGGACANKTRREHWATTLSAVCHNTLWWDSYLTVQYEWFWDVTVYCGRNASGRCVGQGGRISPDKTTKFKWDDGAWLNGTTTSCAAWLDWDYWTFLSDGDQQKDLTEETDVGSRGLHYSLAAQGFIWYGSGGFPMPTAQASDSKNAGWVSLGLGAVVFGYHTIRFVHWLLTLNDPSLTPHDRTPPFELDATLFCN